MDTPRYGCEGEMEVSVSWRPYCSCPKARARRAHRTLCVHHCAFGVPMPVLGTPSFHFFFQPRREFSMAWSVAHRSYELHILPAYSITHSLQTPHPSPHPPFGAPLFASSRQRRCAARLARACARFLQPQRVRRRGTKIIE